MAGFSAYGGIVSSMRSEKWQLSSFLKASGFSLGDRFTDLWLQGGNPPAGTFGTALTARVIDNTFAAAIKFIDPNGTNWKHLLQFGIGNGNTSAGIYILYDRLLEAPFDGTATSGTFNGGTPISIPSRDANGGTDGVGVVMFAEGVNNMTGVTPSLTVQYTNSAGATGHTTVAQAFVASTVGTILPYRGIGPWLPLASGDVGVRKIEAYTLTGTTGATQMNIVLARPLAMISAAESGVWTERDLVLQVFDFPRLYAGTAMSLLFIANGSAPVQGGTITMVEG